MFPARSLIALAVCGVVGASCGGSDERIVVFAASSLTDVMVELEADFEAMYPEVDVVVNTAGSSSLVAQLIDGAPGDVLITADPITMLRAEAELSTRAGSVSFARNEIVIAVERGNPLAVSDLADLRDVPVVVLAAPEVPAGAYAAAVLSCAGLTIEPSSLEQNVRSVAAKIALGEADAGLVYRTDISHEHAAVEVPAECGIEAEYRLLRVLDGKSQRNFVEFALGSAGRMALESAGFGVP